MLLPGSLCDARVFAPQIAALRDRCAITVADLTRDDTIKGMAQRVLAEAPPLFALAGLSMGGIVAMAVAGLAPERVERLALFDTNHRAERPERRALRWSQIEAARRDGISAFFAREVFPLFLPPDCDPVTAAHVRTVTSAMAVACGVAALDRQWRALRDRPDQTDALRRYRGPALVVSGEHDRLCSPKRHREMADLLAGSTLVVIRDAAHLPTLEQPSAVNAVVRKFLL